METPYCLNTLLQWSLCSIWQFSKAHCPTTQTTLTFSSLHWGILSVNKRLWCLQAHSWNIVQQWELKDDKHTSWVLSLLLNLATRSWLLIGPDCRSKAFASSSETPPPIPATLAVAPPLGGPIPVATLAPAAASFFAAVDIGIVFAPWPTQKVNAFVHSYNLKLPSSKLKNSGNAELKGLHVKTTSWWIICWTEN